MRGKRKNSLAIIIIVVTWIRIITSRRKSQENLKMEDRNGVAFTVAVIIRTKNGASRRVAVNVRTVLLLMVKMVENMKPMLYGQHNR